MNTLGHSLPFMVIFIIQVNIQSSGYQEQHSDLFICLNGWSDSSISCLLWSSCWWHLHSAVYWVPDIALVIVFNSVTYFLGEVLYEELKCFIRKACEVLEWLKKKSILHLYLLTWCWRHLRSRSTLGHSRSHWSQGSSSHTGRPQEPRNRSRISTVIQPLRQNAAEVVDLTVDEDGKSEL